MVEIDIARLSVRSAVIEEVMRPFTIDDSGKGLRDVLRCERATAATRRQFVLGVHQGAPPLAYRDWRFSTYRREFRCNYFEIWEPLGERSDRYVMNRAYFTLFRVSGRPLKEYDVVALHADPILGDDEAHVLYKRGPHLHVISAGDPLSHAHIALNKGHLEETLSTIENLSDAIASAVLMIREQIVALTWPIAA
jgi:hypothetical protein